MSKSSVPIMVSMKFRNPKSCSMPFMPMPSKITSIFSFDSSGRCMMSATSVSTANSLEPSALDRILLNFTLQFGHSFFTVDHCLMQSKQNMWVHDSILASFSDGISSVHIEHSLGTAATSLESLLEGASML